MIGERRGNRVHNILSMVKGMFVLLLLAVGCSCGNNVMASIGSVGPDSSANWRYNLTSYGTHKYISLSIPIYFQSDPGTVTIESFDLYVRNAKASFNGGAAVGEKTYRFKVSGFKYDKVSGLYKKTVTVQLRNASGGYGNWTNWEVYQFRLRLIKPTNGWISYGGGRVSQADRDYYKYAENYDVTSLGENQEMYMALPCTYNGSKKVKVNLWDLDDPAGGGPTPNGGHHIRVTFYDVTEDRKLKSFYGPDYPNQMGNNKTLTYEFTMYPGHLYRMVVSNVWLGNLIEYELPFDNISYATGCWESEGKSQVSLNNKTWKTGKDALTNIRPSARLYWKHTVRNTTAWDMKDNVTIKVDETRYNSSDSTKLSSRNVLSTKSKGRAGVTFFNKTNSITVDQDDVGMRICQNESWVAIAYNDVGTKTSDAACATIPYHYPGYQGANEPSSQFSDCTQTGTCPNVASKGGIQLSTGVVGGQTTVTPGESVKFNYTLSNSGPTKSKGLTYKAYTFILKSGTSLSSNSTHMSTYPAGWQNVDCNSTNINPGNASACLMGKNGSGLVIDPSTPKSITSDSYTITNEWLGDPGGQICSYIAVDNNWSVYNDTPANSYAVSNIACVKIGKKPQIQINGSDSYAKNGFTGGSYTDIAINTNRGSYSQYGLLTGSNGSITNFGTAGYTNISSTNQTKACKLAYANTTGLTNTNCSLLGKAAINRTISIPTTPASAIDFSSTTISIPDLVSGRNKGTYSFHYTGSSALTINTSTLPAGYHISIYSDQPVIINGNITLGQNTTIETGGGHVGNNGNHNGNQNGNGNNGNNPNANQGNNGNVGYDTPGQTITTSDAGEGIAYSSLADMPSFDLIAQGNIDVNSNVTILTGNYLAANGSLNTCYNATNEDLGLTGKCSTKLKINGAVISKNSPKLLRTFGSGSSSDYTDQWDANTTSSTSEWFNYTPNSWLVPYGDAKSGTLTGYTISSQSVLPARY